MDEIKGVYIPFWLFDVDADAQITYEAEKVHSHTSGDTEYTTREIYSVYREGSLSSIMFPQMVPEKWMIH